MEAIKQYRTICPFLRSTNIATLRHLTRKSNETGNNGLLALAQTCPVMSKALAVQSTNHFHTSVKLDKRPTPPLRQVSIVSYTPNSIVDNTSNSSVDHQHHLNHLPQQQQETPCKHAESFRQQQSQK